MKRPVLTLLTDFGSRDHYVAAMKGVILGICPDAHIVDISHEIDAYGVLEAAYTIAQAWRCFPAGTVHLVVVDPGVGSPRRPILVEAEGHFFVAPDNGALSLVFSGVGAFRIREIRKERYFRLPLSQTFHGRDLFAPVAAHLAMGEAAAEFGPATGDAMRLELAWPSRGENRAVRGVILKVDRFGNLVTNFAIAEWRELFAGPFVMTAGSGRISRLADAYASVRDGEPFLIAGSAGYFEISVNQGSAAAALGVTVGMQIPVSSTG